MAVKNSGAVIEIYQQTACLSVFTKHSKATQYVRGSTAVLRNEGRW